MRLNTFYRFLLYGLVGIALEVIFTSLFDLAFLSNDLTLPGKSYLWMIPIWGSGLLFLEFVTSFWWWEEISWYKRAAIHCLGFFAIEATSGALIRWMIGEVPWDYSDAFFGIGGLIRLDYAPLWAGLGLAMEKVCKVVRRLEIGAEYE